jgi:transglutaminase-like putative cysteine protease
MTLLTVRHVTTYRYATPVSFGPHRLMLRPRDSHDLRLESAELAVSLPGTLRWQYDVFGNSVASIEFADSASVLSFASTLRVERYALARPDFPIAPEAESYPFMHSADDRTDLGRLCERHYPDPRNVVGDWARQFVTGERPRTWDVLTAMNSAIQATFRYAARHEEGTQTPLETLERGSGTCRDFALLFMEAARILGFGARFVTGYLYAPALDAGSTAQGAGATHAWAEIFLPGAGWVEFDPTNGLIAAENLLRVAVTRDPSQAVPIGGSYVGTPSDYLGMEVEVTVHAEGDAGVDSPPR